MSPAANESTDEEIDILTNLSEDAANSSSNGAFELAAKVAKQCITASSTALKSSTGWTFHNTSGDYTRGDYTDYLLRARKPIVNLTFEPMQRA